MEACQAVEKEVDNVLAKFSDLDQNSQRQLDELLARLHAILSNLQDNREQTVAAATSAKLFELIAEIRAVASRISSGHREMHSSVSKVGKAIDKHFMHDYTVAAIDPSFLEDERREFLVSDIIRRHFQHCGQTDLSEQLATASKLPASAPDLPLDHYVTINRVVGSLRNRRLEPILAWLEQNAARLRQIGSLLEFRVRRLRFLTLLQEGRTQQAISEVRLHISPFCAAYDQLQQQTQPIGAAATNSAACASDEAVGGLMYELRRLMGALAFVHVGIERSPYARLVGQSEWLEVCELFTRDVSRLLGLAADSPLLVLVSAGCKAVPMLMSMRQVMEQRQVSGMWSSNDDLPVEIDVDREYRYHSVFACPILKQQSTEVNPPMRLICGHCISKDALQRLSHGNKLKCPYCPMEMNAADAKLVFF